MNQQQRDFFAEHYAYAREAGLSDVQARLAVSQAAVETGWGTKGVAVKGNNFFGLKMGDDWAGKTINLPTREETKAGKSYTVNADFRQYDSPVDAYRDWAKNMAEKWPGVMKATTFDEAVEALDHGVKGKYATAHDYGTKLKAANSTLERTGIPAQVDAGLPSSGAPASPFDSFDPHWGPAGAAFGVPANPVQSIGATPAPAKISSALDTLHPAFRDRAQAFLDKAKAAGLNLSVLSTGAYRTSALQKAIKATGVQAASPTNSFHNYGLSFDYVPTNLIGTKNWSPNDPQWAKAREIAESVGLFQPFAKDGDLGHVQAIPDERVPQSIKDAPRFTDANGLSYPELPGDILEKYAQPHLQLAQSMAGTGILGVGGNLADSASLVAGADLRPAAQTAAPIGTVTRAPLPDVPADPYAGVPRGVAQQVSTATPAPPLGYETVAPSAAAAAKPFSLSDLINPVSSATAAEMPQVASLSPEATMARVAGVDVTPNIAETEADIQRLEREQSMFQPTGVTPDPTLISANSTPAHMTPGQFGLFADMQPQHVPAAPSASLSPLPTSLDRLSPAPSLAQHLAALAPQLEHLTPVPPDEHLMPTLDTSTLFDRPPPIDPNYTIPSTAAPPMPAPVTVPDSVISPVPGAPPSPTVSPTASPKAITPPAQDVYPPAPPAPSNWSKVKAAVSPIVKDAMLGAHFGLPGMVAGGLLGAFAPNGFDLGPSFDNVVPSADRFSTGFGLNGIEAAMNGPFGATGFSLSNPGDSYTSLGPKVGTGGVGLRRNDKFGYTEVVGPSGEVRGIHYDDPNGGGIFGDISRAFGGFFGGKPTKSEHDYANSHAGLF